MNRKKSLLIYLTPTLATLLPLAAISCKNPQAELDAAVKKVQFEIKDKENKLVKDITKADIKTTGFDSNKYTFEIEGELLKEPTKQKITFVYYLKDKKGNKSISLKTTISGFKSEGTTPNPISPEKEYKLGEKMFIKELEEKDADITKWAGYEIDENTKLDLSNLGLKMLDNDWYSKLGTSHDKQSPKALAFSYSTWKLHGKVNGKEYSGYNGVPLFETAGFKEQNLQMTNPTKPLFTNNKGKTTSNSDLIVEENSKEYLFTFRAFNFKGKKISKMVYQIRIEK